MRPDIVVDIAGGLWLCRREGQPQEGGNRLRDGGQEEGGKQLDEDHEEGKGSRDRVVEGMQDWGGRVRCFGGDKDYEEDRKEGKKWEGGKGGQWGGGERKGDRESEGGDRRRGKMDGGEGMGNVDEREDGKEEGREGSEEKETGDGHSLCLDSLYLDNLYLDNLYLDNLYLDNNLYPDSLYLDSLYPDSLYPEGLYPEGLAHIDLGSLSDARGGVPLGNHEALERREGWS